MKNEITITKREQEAIRALQRLGRKWPKTLQLFSWSGTPTVMKRGQDDRWCSLSDTFHGIPNDGGDPTDKEVDQNAAITYE